MDVNKILSADILDIIFEGRNKEYGAYEMRKTYNKRIKAAIIGMFSAIILLLGGSILANKAGQGKDKIFVQDVALENVKAPEEKKPEIPPPPPPPKQEPPKVEITKFTPPKIVPDEEVKEPPPEVEKLEETKIGTINQEGTKDDGIVAPVEATGTGTVEAPKPVEDYDKLFTSVQIESEFPGGQAAWVKYLERNLNAQVPQENGAPPGRYQIAVSFTVDKEGNISDVSADAVGGANDYGAKEEAIKVIKKGPKWKPGVQNGVQVKSRKKQLVTFAVTEE